MTPTALLIKMQDLTYHNQYWILEISVLQISATLFCTVPPFQMLCLTMQTSGMSIDCLLSTPA